MHRWCSVESKTFELVVQENSSGAWVIERCRDLVRFVFLGRNDCRWLLATVEELLRERESKVFWRCSGTTFTVYLPNGALTNTVGSCCGGTQWR